MAETPAAPIEGKEYCTIHPTVETSLHCNKCGRPMCTRCAVLTPVGYRCRECVRGQQSVFYNSKPLDPVIQAAVSLPLSAIAAGLVGLIGFGLGLWGWFIAVAASSAAGALIADLAHRAVSRRRGRFSWLAVAGAIIFGALLAALPLFVVSSFSIAWLIYVVVATGAAMGRLRIGRNKIL
jgi:hypothetical protein